MSRKSTTEGLMLCSSGLVRLNGCRGEREFQVGNGGAKGAVEKKQGLLGWQSTDMRKHHI